MNPLNTVFDAKRLIGRKYNDASIQADIKHWPFTVKAGPADKPMIEGKQHFEPASMLSTFLAVTANDIVCLQCHTRASGRLSQPRR